MASVSGTLKFDKDRTAVSSENLSGIANVPIVLQNTETNQMIAVTTDANGKYAFINVPDGNYRIVEAYGATASASPGDFSAAVVGNPIGSSFPTIRYANNPPADATNLDAVTPATLLITGAGHDIFGQDRLNGPVKYTPIEAIMDPGVTVMSPNLVTEADGGTFGSFSQGTQANTGASLNPYPDTGTEFTYVLPNPVGITPAFHQYTIQNLMNDATANVQSTWWRISDHTTGNERGRMMVINGDAPGAVIFSQPVSVKANTDYLFSSWILNLSKSASLSDPQLGVEVIDSNGKILYNQTLGELIPMNPNNPEWKQIGTLINAGDNTSLTIRFISMGPEAFGNDYVIDDISLNEVRATVFSPKKMVDNSVLNVGSITKYTVTLENTGINSLTNVIIKDLIPDGLSLIPGSVMVNGVINTAADPDTGFTVADIKAKSTLIVTFDVKADYIPLTNPTINRASVDYNYSHIRGGISGRFSTITNDVPITIEPATSDLSIIKTADKNPVKAGTMLTYTLTIMNNGPSNAQNVSIHDPLSGTEYSTDGGTTWQTWNGHYEVETLSNGDFVSILIRGFVNPSATNPITNTATVESITEDPNLNNNSSTITIPVIASFADLSIVKTASLSSVIPCSSVIYTLVVTNSGPDEAVG
ncbi:MAG: DUF11 domain-containing protein, partial [Lachnoclostridium sp.]|nr:DUF11 domain-containing protein [Lachnoclostridium sp.]